MRPVYAVALVLGSLAVMVWVVMAAVAATVAGREGADPERRFGAGGRIVVASVFGFGMGGVSASYAGWAWPLALGAALAAGTALGYGAALLAGRRSRAA